MTGGLLQLAGLGEFQETYLTGTPEVTYFRQRIAKHTNFAIESVQMPFTSEPKLNNSATCIITRQGDLLYQVYLQVTMTKGNNAYPNARAGYHPIEALVKDVTLSIGGTKVDTLYADWFRIYDTFHRTTEQSEAYRRMTNFDATTLINEHPSTETLYMPLNFYFSRSPGCALPLVSLLVSEVKLTFNFASAEEIGILPDDFTVAIYADLVYLDDAERKVFAASTLDYLIEQVQYIPKVLENDEIPSTESMRTVKCKLPLVRPVKSLYWVLKQSGTHPTMTTHGRYVGDIGSTFVSYQPTAGSLGLMQSISEKHAPVHSARLTINGTERFASRPGSYFNKVQPYQYAKKAHIMPGMYFYSFALRPDDSNPTGNANFSTIKDAELILTLKQSVDAPIASSSFQGEFAETRAKNITGLRELKVFAWGYNLLRIENGLAGLLYGS